MPTKKRVSVLTGELLNAISAAGIQSGVAGIYKLTAYGSFYSVQFKLLESVEQIASLGKIKAGDTDFRQVVSIRDNWLPLFYDSIILVEIFEEFGQVIDTQLLKTANANCVTYARRTV